MKNRTDLPKELAELLIEIGDITQIEPQLLNAITSNKEENEFFIIDDIEVTSHEFESPPKNVKNIIYKVENGKVTELELYFYSLNVLPRQIYKMKALKKLTIKNGYIKQIGDKIANLTNLIYLSIPINKLEYLPDSMGSLSSLRILKLHSFFSVEIKYKLIKIKLLKIISKLHNLRELHIPNIGAEFPREIYNLVHLQKLYLINSKLEKIHPDIRNLTNLKSLIIENGRFSHLPFDLSNLDKLEQLSIASNLPWDKFNGWDIIGKLSNLRYLCISNCRLQRIPSQIFNLKKLEFLDISDNSIHPKLIEDLVHDTRKYFPNMKRFIYYDFYEPEDELFITEFE